MSQHVLRIGGREYRAEIKGIDTDISERFRDIPFQYFLRKPFRKRRFPHTRVAHKYGVVLSSSAKDLKGSFNLGITAYKRIELALFRHFDQINRERFQKIGFFSFFRPVGSGKPARSLFQSRF